MVKNPHEKATKFTAILRGLIDFRQCNCDVKSLECGLWMLRLPEGNCCRVEIRTHFARHFVSKDSTCCVCLNKMVFGAFNYINAKAAANVLLHYVVDHDWTSLTRVERIK